MIRKLRVKPVICFALIFAFVITSMANIVTKSAQAAPNSKELSAGYLNATEKYLNFNKKDNMTFDFNIKKEAQQKGATYSWYVKTDKGDPGAVSINSKTGLVTAKKAGTAYIRCKITLASGSIIRPEAKVVVRNNITEVDISNMPKDQTITLGETMDFDRVILNTDAGKGKGSKGITRWELDKDTAGVKKIKDNGVVKPTTVGSFAIRAVCFQSKEKYKQWLQDKDKYSGNITAASKWYEVSVVESGQEAKVSNQEELELALADNEIKKITIATDKEIKFTIAKGSYGDKTIVVDAPNAEVDNYGSFHKISILAIKENTWNENAEGNSFHVTSVKVRIIVNGNAEVREIIFDRANSVINVEVQGKVHQITILQPSDISLSGNGDQVPITIEETAEGSRLTTSIPLLVEAHNDFEVIINPGAEGTRINKGDAEDKVSVVNNSSASVGVTTKNAGEEQVEAGKSVVVGGTPTPTPPIIPVPNSPSGPIGPTLTSIAIKTPATKTVYKVGEALDITGLVIEGSYSDGSSKTESITTTNITGFNSTTVVASKTLTVTVGGKTATYTIEIIKADGRALSGVIGNDGQNTLTGMTAGMEFSIDGVTWTAYNAAAPNLPDLTGDISIQVRYTETSTHHVGPAMLFTFTTGELVSIEVKTPANKLVYKVGDLLDINGLVIEGTYSDGGKKMESITAGNITGFNSAAIAASQTLTVNVGGKEATFTISIIKADGPALTGVSRDDALNTLNGMVTGMEFSTDGGATWTAYNATPLNLPDLTGNITIQVRYAETETHVAGPAMTFVFTLGVLESITVNASGAKTVYMVGDFLDISGLVVEGLYSDGGTKTETITSANITGFDSSAVTASQTLRVTVGVKSATYTIVINKAPGLLPIGITSDDAMNTLEGMTTGMEFSINGITWTAYEAAPSNLPDLTGTITILVRCAETATHIAGPGVPFIFTAGTLESIEIKTAANKLVYKVGEPLDITGLVIEGTYSDGGKRPVVITTTNITGFNSSAAVESQTLTVNVGEKEATYTISIIKADGAALTGVSSDDALNTLTGMAAGMEFSTDGGTTWEAYDVAEPNLPDLTGDITIQVRYAATSTHEAGASETFTFMAGELLSIAIKTPADKLVYFVGQELDISGLAIEGIYSDGGKRPIVITPANIKGFNNSAAVESQTLTISVEEKEVTYTIRINPPEDITSITVVIPTPYAGNIAVNAADVQAATNDPDFTVTGISWNSLTGYGSYPEWALLTVEVTLTSKNYKQFKSTSYTPVLASASEVSTTTTSGSGTGNIVSFTAQFLVDYVLQGVAGDRDGRPTGEGTIGNPKVWIIEVMNDKDSLTLGDIKAAEGSTVKLYTNPDYETCEITDSGSLPLAVGDNTAYIKVTTPDTAIRFYRININRAKILSSDNNLVTVLGKADTSPTGEGANVFYPCDWEIAVDNQVTEIKLSDIVPADFASVLVFSEASFTNLLTLPKSLNIGINYIYIIVISENGISKYYNVTIDRQPPKEIVSVTGLVDLTVAYGTAKAGISLPGTVSVTMDDFTNHSLPVTWDEGTPVYNGNIARTYVFEGTLTLPEGIINPSAVKAGINVIVEEKELGKDPLTAAINEEYEDGAARTTLKLTQADYTTDSWLAYTNAISAAITLEGTGEVTQQQIDDAIIAIGTEKAILIFAGKASLDAVKGEASLLAEGNYSSDLWVLLTAALDLPEATNAQVVYKTSQINTVLTLLATELIDQAITNAKDLIPATLTMAEGTDTNLLNKLNTLKDMEAYGVTLSVSSTDNSNIDTYGNITYTGSEVNGDVTIRISKGEGTEQTVTINVIVPKQKIYSVTFSYTFNSTHDFGNQSSSYDIRYIKVVNCINKDSDSEVITNLQITFEGTDPDAFTYTPVGTWHSTLTNEENYNEFSFHPVSGLVRGTYSATMVISADHGIRYEVALKFQVS